MNKKNYIKPDIGLIDKPTYDELLEIIDKYKTKIDDYEIEIKEAHNAINEANDSLHKAIDNTQKAIDESAEYKDKYLRALADYQNLKRITDERLLAINKDSKVLFFKSLLPIIDNFEQAIDAEDITEGCKIIYNQLINLLHANKVETIEPETGDKFDDNLHEAVAPVQGNDENKNTIAMVQQKGYKTENKIIRYAKVVVYV